MVAELFPESKLFYTCTYQDEETPTCHHTKPDCRQLKANEISKDALARKFIPVSTIEGNGKNLWWCPVCAEEYCEEYGYGK